jgi:mutator protein MutT
MAEEIARTNVAAVVRDADGKVLLCKRAAYKRIAPGVWHMPGGAIEAGETLARAITRELKEEESLTVAEVKETGVSYDYPAGPETHRTIFVAATVTGTLVLNHENEAYAFVAVEEFARYIEPELVAVNRRAVEEVENYSISAAQGQCTVCSRSMLQQ